MSNKRAFPLTESTIGALEKSDLFPDALIQYLRDNWHDEDEVPPDEIIPRVGKWKLELADDWKLNLSFDFYFKPKPGDFEELEKKCERKH